MTIYDFRCDWCGISLPGPDRAVRFVYHPGSASLKDDSGTACSACWERVGEWLGEAKLAMTCAACGQPIEAGPRLVVSRMGEIASWQLCRADAVEFLNQLRTVDPKLDPATFAFPEIPPPA